MELNDRITASLTQTQLPPPFTFANGPEWDEELLHEPQVVHGDLVLHTETVL